MFVARSRPTKDWGKFAACQHSVYSITLKSKQLASLQRWEIHFRGQPLWQWCIHEVCVSYLSQVFVWLTNPFGYSHGDASPLKGIKSQEISRDLSTGMEREKQQQNKKGSCSLGFSSCLIEIDIWHLKVAKTLPFCTQSSVPVTP